MHTNFFLHEKNITKGNNYVKISLAHLHLRVNFKAGRVRFSEFSSVFLCFVSKSKTETIRASKLQRNFIHLAECVCIKGNLPLFHIKICCN